MTRLQGHIPQPMANLVHVPSNYPGTANDFPAELLARLDRLEKCFPGMYSRLEYITQEVQRGNKECYRQGDAFGNSIHKSLRDLKDQFSSLTRLHRRHNADVISKISVVASLLSDLVDEIEGATESASSSVASLDQKSENVLAPMRRFADVE